MSFFLPNLRRDLGKALKPVVDSASADRRIGSIRQFLQAAVRILDSKAGGLPERFAQGMNADTALRQLLSTVAPPRI